MDEQQEPISLARRTYLNMLRALPALHRKDGEDAGYRERIEAFFCPRWNCAGSTFRKFTGKTFPPTRVPTVETHPQFFKDLKKYGAARFDKSGHVVKASLDKGPDAVEFMLSHAEAKRNAPRI